MAYRKDLERSALMMDKIKNPQKIPTLGAKKIMTENTSSEKDYLIDIPLYYRVNRFHHRCPFRCQNRQNESCIAAAFHIRI